MGQPSYMQSIDQWNAVTQAYL